MLRLGRQYGILDVPNSRSSHTAATPRGGGVGIVLVFLATVLFFWMSGRIRPEWGGAFFVGGALVAVVGFMDDVLGLPAPARASIHILAGLWVIWRLHVPQTLRESDLQNWVWPAAVICLMALVWLTNLFNFMDGIDGLAGTEAVFVASSQAVLLSVNGFHDLSSISWAIAAAVLGFLVWNWPPAKIFMGDVGSGFLGFIFGVLAICGASYGLKYLIACFILLLAFVADATITLLRRMSLGGKWYKAHRTHAYQRAARKYQSHRLVTLAVLALDVGWLLPMAWAVIVWPRFALPLAVAAAIPTIALILYFRPGEKDRVCDGLASSRGN